MSKLAPTLTGDAPVYQPPKAEVLYFVIRDDLPRGRQAAQLIHAMDSWCAEHGPHGGVVLVYSVPTLKDLTFVLAKLAAEPTATFREPDLGYKVTALVTSTKPADLNLDLPLLC